jgi:hypothetical protein
LISTRHVPELLRFDAPPQQWLNEAGNLAPACANLLWNGLSTSTHRNYHPAHNSYETFCALHSIEAWPATPFHLTEWVTIRAHSSTFKARLKPDTIESYLSALRSVHIDRRLPTAPFDDEFLKRVVAGVFRVSPTVPKAKAAPIMPEILKAMTSVYPNDRSIDELNVNRAANVAFAGFLRSAEFMWRKSVLERLTCSDVTFSDNDEHVRIRLKHSKTDFKRKGVDVLIGAKTTNRSALSRLYKTSSRLTLSLLPRLSSVSKTHLSSTLSSSPCFKTAYGPTPSCVSRSQLSQGSCLARYRQWPPRVSRSTTRSLVFSCLPRILQYERVSAALPEQALSDGSLSHTPLLAANTTVRTSLSCSP